MSAESNLVIVSGLSGAGRTTAIKALEDLGYYCVDNLPVVLLDRFLDLFSEGAERLAVVIDVRERDFLQAFPEIYDRLRERGVLAELLFLDATDEILAQRFDETRRVHPASPRATVRDSIAEERRILAPLGERADVVVDTSEMSVHDLKRTVTRRYTGGSRGAPMEIELVSFGFRFGAPDVADLLLDVRFLPNPNFEPELRESTGEEPAVAAFVLRDARTEVFLARFYDFLDFLVPLYEDEGKAYLTVAIGCTGGKHRSVALAERTRAFLEKQQLPASVHHRDLGRE